MGTAWFLECVRPGGADRASLAAASLGLYGRCIWSSVAVQLGGAWLACRAARVRGSGTMMPLSDQWGSMHSPYVSLQSGLALVRAVPLPLHPGSLAFWLGRFKDVTRTPWMVALSGTEWLVVILPRCPLLYGFDPVHSEYLHLQSGWLEGFLWQVL
jgi:hypothetical protein